jgi:hypothetical protein
LGRHSQALTTITRVETSLHKPWTRRSGLLRSSCKTRQANFCDLRYRIPPSLESYTLQSISNANIIAYVIVNVVILIMDITRVMQFDLEL